MSEKYKPSDAMRDAISKDKGILEIDSNGELEYVKNRELSQEEIENADEMMEEAERLGLGNQKEMTESREVDYEAEEMIMEDEQLNKYIFSRAKTEPTNEEVAKIKDTIKQMRKAKEIFGKDFCGPKEIEWVLGHPVYGQIAPEKIPEIPFSQNELERAKDLGQMLVLRINKTAKGEPLTIGKMNEVMEGQIKSGVLRGYRLLEHSIVKRMHGGYPSHSIMYEKGRVANKAWYKNEDFFNKETPALRWALISKDVMPGSKGGGYYNYLHQTELIVKFLTEEVFKDQELPDIYQEAIKEFESQKEEIASMIESDWKEAARRLTNLKITRLTRNNAAEELYDMLIRFRDLDERDKLDMQMGKKSAGQVIATSSRSSDGKIVCLEPNNYGAEINKLYPLEKKEIAADNIKFAAYFSRLK